MGAPASRRAWRGLLGLIAVSVALSYPTDARAAGAYTAAADARLVAVDVTAVPSILFDPLLDPGASVAQAQIDSLGGTAAFASTLYPGSTVLGLPGLLAGYGFPSGSVPSYPVIVSSNQSVPADHREAGTIVLDAQSQPGSSTATETDGAASATATTSVDTATDTVHAHAETAVPTVQLGTALALSGVRTVADVVKGPTGDLTRTSSFEVSSLTILGQRVTLTSTGLSLLGTDVPLGVDANALLAPLLGALTASGT
ncbi:MAG: hypothetical protein QOE63_107, partial [Acidimicrobiaceae bacterium]